MRQFAYGLLLCATLSASVSAQQTNQAEVARLLAQIQATLAADGNGSASTTIGSIPETSNPPRSVTIGVASKQYPVEPPEPPKVIRAYDLADLFAIAPNARAVDWISDSPQPLLPANTGTASNGPGPTGGMSGIGGGMGGGGMGGGMGGSGMGGMMNVSDDNQIGASINGLINLLEDTTDGEWDSEEETITQLGGTLVVRATENSQRQIESLLNLLSQRWNSKVVVRTEIDYVYLNKEESKKVQSGLDAESEGNEKHWTTAEWSDFRDQLSEDRPAGYHVRLTGFNGQNLAWTSGEQHRAVSDVTMGRKGRLESLNLSHPHSGVVCETRASLSHSKDIATLNVASRLLRSGTGNDSALAEPASGVKVDRQSTVGQAISVSTRIPLDTVSLIAIGTDDEFDTAWQLHIIANIHEVKKP